MSYILRNPAAISATRILPAFALVTIALFTFLVFRMPLIAGLGLCALGVLCLGLRFPIVTLYIYAASTFLSYVHVVENVKAGVPTLAGALFLIAAGGNAALSRTSLKTQSSMYRWLGYFIVANFIAALANPRWFMSNPRGLVTFISLTLTTIAVAHLLRSERSIIRVGEILSLGAVAVAALTCYQSLTGAYNSFGLFTSRDAHARAYGIADPNYTAAILVTFFPLLFAQTVSSKSLISRCLATSGLVIVLAGVGMTASRGGFLGMVITGCVCLFVMGSSGVSRRSFRTVARRIGVAALLVCAFAVALAVSPDSLWDRLSGLENQKNVHNESRLTLWTVYGQEWLGSPVFGYGPGYMDPEAAEGRLNIPHSTPLEFMLEIGGLGFLAYVGLCWCAIRELWRIRRTFGETGNSKLRAFSGALIAAFVGFHFTALFLNRDNDKQLWLLFGMTIAVVAIGRRQCLERLSTLQPNVVLPGGGK